MRRDVSTSRLRAYCDTRYKRRQSPFPLTLLLLLLLLLLPLLLLLLVIVYSLGIASVRY